MTGKKYSNKNVFVLPSYVGLPAILRNFNLKDSENIFLTNNPALYQWLASLKLEVILTPTFSNDLSRKAIKGLKAKNIAIADDFDHCNIHYFFYLSSIPMLHLLQTLSRRNQLFYTEMDPTFPKLYLWNLKDRKEITKMVITKLVFGSILKIWPNLYKIDGRAMVGKKLKQAREKEMSTTEPIHVDNLYLLKQSVHIQPIDILYIDNVSVHFPEAAKYIASILMKVQQMGRTVHIKPHPNFPPIEDFLFFPIISREIPSEICMHSANLIIGVFSTSLNELVDGKVISMLKLLNLPSITISRLKKNLKSDTIIYVDSEENLFSELSLNIRTNEI